MPTGFTIRGIEPDEVRRSPQDVRLMFWSWAMDLIVKAKDKEIASGIQADGSPMRPITAETRRHRRSAMTASGKGDPSAPPLIPGRKLSRTRSLLAANAYPDRVEVYWLFDVLTGDSWSKILTYQAEAGRDVFGLTPADLQSIRMTLLGRWLKWTRGDRIVPAEFRGKAVITAHDAASSGGNAAPSYARPPGTTDLTNATMGIGVSASTERAIASGNWSGGLTEAELRAFATGRAPANVQSRPGNAYNRILSHVWGGPPGGATPVQPLSPRRPDLPSPTPPAPNAKPATPRYAVQDAQGVADRVKEVFGRSVPLERVAGLTGAPHGASVRFELTSESVNGVRMIVEHPDVLEMVRTVASPQGVLQIHNGVFRLPESAPRGTGTAMFARQVEEARGLKAKQIVTDAAKGDGFVGYYVWPRLGYDAEITTAIRDKLANPATWTYRDRDGNEGVLPESMRSPKSLADLMATPEGRAWWQQHGDYTFGAIFNLRANSRSMRTLRAYLAESGSPAGQQTPGSAVEPALVQPTRHP